MGYAQDPVEEDASADPFGQVAPVVPAGGTVTLATAPPLGSVTVDGVEITEAGTEVDADTAARAHEAAQAAGFTLRTIT